MARSAGSSAAALVADLRRRVRGAVLDDGPAREEVASDFGGLVHRRPDVVVRPLDSADVASVITFAAARQVPVTTRGTGHSQGGQSLASAGISLDTRRLDTVGPVTGPGPGAIEVGAGARWGDLVAAVAGRGLVPPVLTNYPWATVGGTTAAGGIGTTSFRYGSQAANCRELEVVTGTGEIVRCSPSEQPELFRHALCGLGQVGVLTRVRHGLRHHRRLVHTEVVVSTDLDELLADLRVLTERGTADALDAFVVRHPRDASWVPVLRASTEVDEQTPPPEPLVPPARRRLPARWQSFGDQVRLSPRPSGPATDPASIHPWTDAFLSWTGAADTIRAALGELPADLPCEVAFRPLRTDPDRTPLLSVPPGPSCLGFGVFATVPRARTRDTVAALDRLLLRLAAGGARPYLSGWGTVDRCQGPSHYGDAWPALQQARRRFDPAGILNPQLGLAAPAGGRV